MHTPSPEPTALTDINVRLSRVVADGVNAEKRMCWRNALMAILTLAETGVVPELEGASYVEGYVVTSDIPMAIEHGFILTATGQVVDPTLILSQGKRIADNRYFIGIIYATDEARKRSFAGEGLPLAMADMGDPSRRGPWVAASQAAWKAVTGFDLPPRWSGK